MRVDRADLRKTAPLSPLQRTEAEQPVVAIVDDEASVREALSELFLSADLQSLCFASICELLDSDVLNSPGCLVLDVHMPEGSGLELQRHLAQGQNPKPIIFLTGQGDIPTTVRAMKAGAIDFLTKPVSDNTLLAAVRTGIALDAALRAEAAVVKRNVERLETLTPRECQVLHEVARGRLNKQIAFDLGIREVTVKVHRANAMRKMEVTTIGELIRVWERLPAQMRKAGSNQALSQES